ncbi:Sporulation initiation phosphotransferase F [Candidatus Nitrosocosmicus oleophilus]|uniref:Sporulation initiation phosphotransferase F n=1 Tax=Candidatus Nitrosocosmicus oleophilus TaxID=1353260 RepID=A0A654LXI0_9ARCH|nr:response regulator [Candidatus Nitrosocosmicus oleophilus]ALI35905.1 Sporulation initiation phosphotransferase F [Candidatus Nitrosocosmicus oleophilus]
MSSSSDKSIIIVDDEIELADLFKEFLKKEGFNAISFTDPIMALEYFRETSGKHSLIITDMRMPDINGIDLAKNIREINNEIKIFLMTAFDAKDLKDHENFKIARIDRIIQKPIRFPDLREMINDAWKK